MSSSEHPQTVEEISFLDPHTSSNPYPAFALLQRECPVYRVPETGAYMITRYEDVRDVLRDHETFSNQPAPGRSSPLRGRGPDLNAILRERGWEHVNTLQRTDPPQHARYRKLLDRVFTAPRVEEMVPYIDSRAAELVDSFIDDGTCEFNSQFAMPMPGSIIAEQLGLGRDEIQRFKRWADAMLGVSYGPAPITEEQALQNAETELEAQHYLAGVFEERRANPQNDLISRLVHAHGDDVEPLSVHELQNVMHQLITGGFETTQSAINHGMWTLVRHPELVARLHDDPSAMKPFVEEVLRWESPVVFLGRTTTRDATVGDTTIPEGSAIMVGFGPGNRDPERFAHPHEFDMDRDDITGHLAFGNGAHYCVGAMLARQEMVSAFSEIVKRMDEIELAQPLPDPVHYFSWTFLPMHDFHIKFRKREA